MNYRYMIPSLEEIIIIKISIPIMTQELKRSMYCFDSQQDVNDAAKEEARKLHIPEALKMKILEYIEFSYYQMKEWFHYHKIFLHANRKFMPELCSGKLCWTVNGIIDRKKTAELLVQDERLDIYGRYKLACLYCFENDIPKLWNEPTVPFQKVFHDKGALRNGSLVVFWNGIKLEPNEDASQLSSYQYALNSAVIYGNEVAIEYLLQKLNPELRDEYLLNCVKSLPHPLPACNFVPKGYSEGALCYLFLQMSKSQQMEVLRLRGHHILHSLLHWQWLQFFIPTVKHMLNALYDKDYVYLTLCFVLRIEEGLRVSEYHKIFSDFWQLTPSDSRRHVRHMMRYHATFRCLILLQDIV